MIYFINELKKALTFLLVTDVILPLYHLSSRVYLAAQHIPGVAAVSGINGDNLDGGECIEEVTSL